MTYYLWWRDDCFGLLIHHDALFHFMVSISDEYKHKRLVKTTFKSVREAKFTTCAIDETPGFTIHPQFSQC